MLKKGLLVLTVVALLASMTLLGNANDKKSSGDDQDVKIGGHLKMYLFDSTGGTSTCSGVDYDNTDKWGFGFGGHTFILFISKNISENLSVEIAPDYSLGSAGATPSLGKKLGQQRKSTSSTTTNPNSGGVTNLKLNQEFVKYNLPEYKLELRAGYMSCMFTEEYGKETWWHEEMNAPKAVLYLGGWHDSGVEAYRNFEFGGVSMPAYLYLLNGSGGTAYTDNNSNKTIMFHVAPEFSGKLSGLKGSASYGFGAWGDQDYAASYGTTTTINPPAVAASLKNAKYYRYALGGSYDYQKFTVRAEWMGANWENKFNYGTPSEADQGSWGYYAKFKYKIVPDKWTGMLNYSEYHTEKNAAVSEIYKTTTLGAQYEIAPAATVIFQLNMEDWKDDAAAQNAIDVNRMVIGVRVTF
ncbi:MAG TPA: hypothetical protein VJC37_08730 [Planctomycetota bacterium]|nr:hypothetical protein [Planctomycetota bacterium]